MRFLRTDEKKGKKSSPRMVWSCASGTVETLIYVDRSLCGDPTKENLIDEINFKNCVRLRKKKTGKFFVGITFKKKFIIHPEFFMPTI